MLELGNVTQYNKGMAGRPRLHINKADKQFAYRQRQRAQRDNERDELNAWRRVRARAVKAGILIGDETEFRAATKIAQAIEAATASDGAAPVSIPFL